MTAITTAGGLEAFQLSEGEALALAAAKHWLMSQDLALDPEESDRLAKHTVILEYELELHRAFQQELSATDVPRPSFASLAGRLDEPGWPAAWRRCLGDCEFSEHRSLFGDWRVVSTLLGSVKTRDRAVLLTVELASFYPWPPKVRYEKSVRAPKLKALASAFGAPLGADYVNEIDRELRSRARRLALKNMNWKKAGLIAAGGAVLGAVTGGLAAPLVGGAIGSSMGLGGAAAANAGLALLGGGSLAAGGTGVAGGTLVVTGVAGVGLAGVAGGGAALQGGPSVYVLADMVKLDVLTKYVLLREQAEPAKVRAVVVTAEKRQRETEVEIEQLRTRVAKLEALEPLASSAADVLVEREVELDATKTALKEARASNKVLSAEVESLRRHLRDFEAPA